MMSLHSYDSISLRRPVSMIIYEYARMQDMMVHCAIKTTFRGIVEAAACNFGTESLQRKVPYYSLVRLYRAPPFRYESREMRLQIGPAQMEIIH